MNITNRLPPIAAFLINSLAAVSNADDRPNIVILFADDMGFSVVDQVDRN